MSDAPVLAWVADELPVAIWLGRVPSGEVVYTNAAFREILGIDPPDGAQRGAFVAPYGVHTPTGEPYPEEKMPFERVLAKRAPVVVEDLVIHRHDGRRVYLRVFAKPIFAADGTITHVLEAFTDITREASAEHARAEGERRLARAQRLESIGQLVAGIAHDFNNLLTVTKLGLAALRGSETKDARGVVLQQIEKVTDSGITLIKSLLGFARRERHVMAPVSLDSVVSLVVSMAERTFGRGITFRSELQAGDTEIMGDSSQLEQMLMNLVINARDAVAGLGEVIVRTRVLPEDARVVLEVIDTGHGIDPEIRERIFEPYFTTKTQGATTGTGLGLATVHGTVQTHGGTIEVADNTPCGTIMRVTFPSSNLTAVPAKKNGASGAAVSELLPRTDGRLLLVIDDDPLVRASTSASLRALGFRVCDAEDGVTALEVFALRRAEVAGVVLDMVMPGLRGRDIYLGLRALRPDVPVLLVSGCALDDEAQSILDLGVGGWLPKPYDDKALAASLQRLGVL